MDQWIINEDELKRLIASDRLCRVHVRYRGKTEGRLEAAAQYVPDLVEMLEATDHHVRDMCRGRASGLVPY